MSKRVSLLSAAIAALMLPAAASATNGYFTHGFGVRSQAVAGVGIALAQDSLTAANNPAGIALVGNRLDIGASYFRPSRGSEIVGNRAGANGSYDADDSRFFVIPEVGYVRELNEQLTAGLAIYGNGGMNTDYGTNPLAAFGSKGHAGVNLEQVFITPTLAYQPIESQSLAIGVTYAYQRFEMKGVGAFDNPFFSAAPGRVTNEGVDSSNGWGLKLGWIGQITPTLSLGATWSSEFDMERFSKYSGLFAERGGFAIPKTYGLGASWKASAALTVAADWQKIEYSTIKSVGNPLQNLLAGNPLGSANGGGFGWDDISVVKLGAVYAYSDKLTLRAGISRADQPIPASETFFSLLAPGTVRDHLSLGASWKTAAGGEWSIAYTHALKETVNGKGSIPAPFGGGEANIHLKEDILTVGYSFDL
ncbi:MAG: outer membrane protein transport protein [Pseudomonadota bacterium]